MRKYWLTLIFLLVFTTSFAQKVMKEISVSGNRDVDSELIINISGLKQGEPVSRETLKSAIKKIYSLGLFKDVKIDLEDTEDGVAIKILVAENPTVSSIIMEGNRKIKEKDILEKIHFKKGSIFTDKKLFDSKVEIKGMYEEKGYYHVEIEDELSEPDSNNRIKIKLVVKEGKKLKIREIEIEGNVAYKDKTIEKQMRNREKKWYRKALFRPDLFEADLDSIRFFYLKKGHLEAEVLDYDMTYDDKKEWVTITIRVFEGKKYHVGKIDFEGNYSFTSENLKKELKIKTGDVYSMSKANESVQNLHALYYEEGYIYTQLLPEESSRADSIDILYRITENNPAKVRKVNIFGNDRTREKVIRREFVLFPGELFKRSKVARSQREVFNLGFFQDITLDYKRINEDGDIDLTFNVEEKPGGRASAGASYSTDGFGYNFNIAHPNLFGRGWRINLLAERFGKRRQNYSLGFTEPWFFDRPTSVGFDAFYLTRHLNYYKVREAGGDVRLVKEFPYLDYTTFHWMYKLQNVYTYDITSGYRTSYGTELKEGSELESSVRLGLDRDSRDNIFNATTGSKTTYMVKFAGGLLAGDADYHRHIFETKWYSKTFWKFVLMTKFRCGFVDGYVSPKEVPDRERFKLGGIGNDAVRGYPNDWISPARDWYKIGGRFSLIISAEYKLIASEQIFPLIFFDAGNTWSELNECSPTNLYKGAGVGIRIDIPGMFPMGFDFGYGFAREKWEPHFQLGTIF